MRVKLFVVYTLTIYFIGLFGSFVLTFSYLRLNYEDATTFKICLTAVNSERCAQNGCQKQRLESRKCFVFHSNRAEFLYRFIITMDEI